MLTPSAITQAEKSADEIETADLAKILADDFNQRPTNWDNWSDGEKRPFLNLARTAKGFLASRNTNSSQQ